MPSISTKKKIVKINNATAAIMSAVSGVGKKKGKMLLSRDDRLIGGTSSTEDFLLGNLPKNAHEATWLIVGIWKRFSRIDSDSQYSYYDNGKLKTFTNYSRAYESEMKFYKWLEECGINPSINFMKQFEENKNNDKYWEEVIKQLRYLDLAIKRTEPKWSTNYVEFGKKVIEAYKNGEKDILLTKLSETKALAEEHEHYKVDSPNPTLQKIADYLNSKNK